MENDKPVAIPTQPKEPKIVHGENCYTLGTHVCPADERKEGTVTEKEQPDYLQMKMATCLHCGSDTANKSECHFLDCPLREPSTPLTQGEDIRKEAAIKFTQLLDENGWVPFGNGTWHNGLTQKSLEELYSDLVPQSLSSIQYKEDETDRACPCLYLEEPCHPSCTCRNGGSSIGCAYCCSYGSIEQRKQRALILSQKLKFTPEEKDTVTEGKDICEGCGKTFNWTLHGRNVGELADEPVVCSVQCYEKITQQTPSPSTVIYYEKESVLKKWFESKHPVIQRLRKQCGFSTDEVLEIIEFARQMSDPNRKVKELIEWIRSSEALTIDEVLIEANSLIQEQ